MESTEKSWQEAEERTAFGDWLQSMQQIQITLLFVETVLPFHRVVMKPTHPFSSPKPFLHSHAGGQHAASLSKWITLFNVWSGYELRGNFRVISGHWEKISRFNLLPCSFPWEAFRDIIG